MAQGTTYSLPNYVGQLYSLTREDTPFLSTIGGLTGTNPKTVNSVIWTWSTETNRAADKYRQRLEGADAPAATQRGRTPARNVLEIHQEAVETSYTKQAATGQFGSTGSSNTSTVGVAGANPVMNEHAHQTELTIKATARDIEQSFVSGLYNEPTDNTTARRTRGIIQATATNVTDAGTLVGDGASTIATNGTITEASHGLSNGDIVHPRALGTGAIGVLEDNQGYYVTGSTTNTFTLALTAGGSTITFASTGTADFYKATQLTETHILDTMQLAWANGGLMESETRTIMCNAPLRRRLTAIFITGKGYIEGTRNVGGVSLSTIQTDFGACNIMMSRFVPTGAMLFLSLEECQPVFLDIPGKGHFFIEPLAKTGAAEKDQLYGEVGLEYGNEIRHAKILGVKA